MSNRSNRRNSTKPKKSSSIDENIRLNRAYINNIIYGDPKKKHGTAHLSSYEKLLRDCNNAVRELTVKHSSLSESFIKNVIAYIRCLPKPGSAYIDYNVFDAQMARRFGMGTKLFNQAAYTTACRGEENLSLARYAEMICIFLSKEQSHRAKWAYDVYCCTRRGTLDRRTLEMLIRPMLMHINAGEGSFEETTDDEEDIKTMVQLLMSSLNIIADDSVDEKDWLRLVSHEPLMIECLGPVLPDAEYVKIFRDLLETHTSFEIQAHFRLERRLSLFNPKYGSTGMHSIQDNYPIPLELP